MKQTSAKVGDRPAIVWFDLLLGLVTILLLFVTILLGPLLVLMTTGRGDLELPVRIDPPFSLSLDPEAQNGFPNPQEMGRRIDVTSEGTSAYVNFPIGQERNEFRDTPSVDTKLKVSRDDRDTRGVAAALAGVVLALAWVGTLSLRRLIRSARDGRPFDSRNVRRLRSLAVVLLLIPVLIEVATRVLDQTLDSTVNASVRTGSGTPATVFVLLGFGLLALAAVFRVGTDLADLDESTI